MIDWIDIKNSQPIDGTSVLICGPELYTCEAHLWDGEWLCDGLIDKDIVTHWMSLPKPLRGKVSRITTRAVCE